MTGNSVNTKPGKQYRLAAIAVLRYCLFLFLTLSLCSSQFNFSGNYHPLYKGGHVLCSATSSNHARFPFSHPFMSESVVEEIEMADDAGESDFTDIAFSQLVYDQWAEVVLSLGNARKLFVHLTTSIQSRSVASLFVLHHSWKSFLV